LYQFDAVQGLPAPCILGEVCPLQPGNGEAGAKRLCSFKSVSRGSALYRAGDRFNALFQVVRGSFKAVSPATYAGSEQVLGFYMSGSIMGLDAIPDETYPCTAVALEDSSICAVAYGELSEVCGTDRRVQRNLHVAMSREIQKKEGIMLLLGRMTAEQRVAVLLLNIQNRATRLAQDMGEISIPMSRRDMASFLGMTLETLSRTFAKLQTLGLIRARARNVAIVNRPGLEALKDAI
jgi:CRP/FNR family transcriptional regulator